MPSGEVHYKYYKRGHWFILVETVFLFFIDAKLGFGNLIGYILGRWIDPDWDLVTANNSESRMIKELPILGSFLFGISSTYGSFFFHHHRGFFSHFPFISTAIRLFFVFVIPFIILDEKGINFIGNGWIWFWAGVWIGLSQADAIHWFLDMTYGD